MLCVRYENEHNSLDGLCNLMSENEVAFFTRETCPRWISALDDPVSRLVTICSMHYFTAFRAWSPNQESMEAASTHRHSLCVLHVIVRGTSEGESERPWIET